MRFETHRVSEYVVRSLHYGSSARVLVDGGDIIEFALTSGAHVSLHLIESELALYEAEQILRANGARGVYTLFLFWRDLLLPDDGHVFALDRWLAAWVALYGGKVYGYDFNGPDVYLFPVHIEPLAVGGALRADGRPGAADGARSADGWADARCVAGGGIRRRCGTAG